MATALVTQIAYAVQSLFDPAGAAGRLVDLGKLANYGLLTSFTPAYLFTTGVNGTWYDPSDITTLYRDAAGTQPVTAVEQPVGLMLDKSKGLVPSPELVTNGDFSNGTTGWTAGGGATISTENGQLKIVAGPGGGAYTTISCVIGVRYKVTLTGYYSGTSLVRFGIGSAYAQGNEYDSGDKSATTDFSLTFTAARTAEVLWLFSSNGGTSHYDNVSVSQVLPAGNHAFNGSGNSANFPVLSARYNLLTKSEDFSDAAWSKFTAGGITITVTANAGVAPDGSTTADRVTSTGDASVLQNGGARVSGTVYTMSMWVKRAGSTNQTFRLGAGNGTSQDFSGNFTATNEWQRFSFNVTATGGGSGIYDGVTRDSSNNPYDILVWGADLRVANDALNQPAYQRVNTATDYDTVGFKPYLRFNGTNQWLQTNSIDFTYGDKMFVSAGVRKLSDAVKYTPVVEFSTNAGQNNGAFQIMAPDEPNTYYFRSRGTSTANASSSQTFASPITNVISSIGNISGDQAILRVNGTQAAISIADQGTSNYGNYQMFIGATAGSSLWFNGRLYQMVVAGKQASAAEITSTETYLNQKTGAF